VNHLINPTVSDAVWIQMTFIPEKLGIKSSNWANFLKCFDRRLLPNRRIRAVSDPAISILAVKIFEGLWRLNLDGETNNDIISRF
jgi:hypothetical protein